MVIIVKKRILILALLSFMITGVVSAASLWGSYKGNAIIKVTVDSKQYKNKVPPVSLDGQVMVPLSLFKQLGISYTYDKKKMTASIISPDASIEKEQPVELQQELDKFKAYVKIADYYHELDELGQSFANIASNFEVVYHHYMVGTDPGVSIDDAFNYFNNQVERYNDRLTIQQMAEFEATKVDADVSDVIRIMKNYGEAADYYQKSLQALEEIAHSGYSKSLYDTYFNNASTGLDIVHKNSLAALEKYNNYISIVTK